MVPGSATRESLMLSAESKTLLERFDAEIRRLQQIGAEFHSRGWSLGTSSNYSVVVGGDPLQLLLTASGKDKGCLAETDFVLVDETGQSVSPPPPGLRPRRCCICGSPGSPTWEPCCTPIRSGAPSCPTPSTGKGDCRSKATRCSRGWRGCRRTPIAEIPDLRNTQDIAELAGASSGVWTTLSTRCGTDF